MSDALTLNDVCSMIVDCEHNTAPESLPGREYGYSIGTPNIRNGRMILDSAKRVDEATFRAWSIRAVLQKGDIILTREAPAGEAALVDGTVPVCLGQRTVMLRPNPAAIVPQYLHYRLLGPAVQEIVSSRSGGSTVAHLNVQDIRKLALGGVPDLPTQDAIAAILGALDDKIAVNDRIAGTGLALGDACFAEMLQTSAAGRSTLAELAAEKAIVFGDGYRTKRSEHGRPGLPILRAAEVKDGRIEPGLADFVAETYRSAMGSKISQAGDVILTTKGTVGRVALIAENGPSFVYSPQLCYFRVLAGSLMANSVVYFWLRSDDFWQQAEARKSQTDMADYLSLADIRKLTIPVPDPTLSRQLSTALSGLLGSISACHEESKELVKLRDYLLPRLMAGEIRMNDAEKVAEDVT